MSYFIPRPRILIPLAPGELKLPTRVSVEVTLAPGDLFGPGELEPRSTTCVGQQVHFRWNGNIGRMTLRSETFLPPLRDRFRLERRRVDVRFDGSRMTLTGRVHSREEVNHFFDVADIQLPTFLSVHCGVFVYAETMRGRFADGPPFRCDFSFGQARNVVLTESVRIDKIAAAVRATDDKNPRDVAYTIACLYYRQALRLVSAAENRLPELNISEIAVNLAKCLEALFGDQRDRLRRACAALGFADHEIEQQIIPICLVRDGLDGAHPVGARADAELVEALRKYTHRALNTVGTVLVRAERGIGNGSFIPPTVSQLKSDKAALLRQLQQYLELPELKPDL